MSIQSGNSGSDDIKVSNDDVGGFDFFGEAVKLPTLNDTDMCIFVQPNQEIIDSVDNLSKGTGTLLIALFNPQWRNFDDVLVHLPPSC